LPDKDLAGRLFSSCGLASPSPPMTTDHTALVSKVWNYAHVLRDQGIA
jgi:hypothetical protein